jgi:hypothetical protein
MTAVLFRDGNFVPDQDGVLRNGECGPAVLELQELLTKAGFTTGRDGKFGDGTETAVRLFQKKAGLVVDGIAGPKTLAHLRNPTFDRRLLTQADLEWAAKTLKVSVAAVMAVNEVESRGSGFFSSGSAAILYERHVMRKRLRAHGVNPGLYEIHHPELVNAKTGGYRGGQAEYDRLQKAQAIHREAALESCSWGGYQIMGYHWKVLGYASIDDFVTRMQRSERDQLEAFVRFIQQDPVLQRALKELDWTGFAKRYNGPGYYKHNPPYDVRLSTAHSSHLKKLKALRAVA